jgi:hypothetical protein
MLLIREAFPAERVSREGQDQQQEPEVAARAEVVEVGVPAQGGEPVRVADGAGGAGLVQPSVSAILARLHRADWSIGDAAFQCEGGRLVWLVSGHNGENLIRADGLTRAAWWWAACRQAEAVGMLARRWSPCRAKTSHRASGRLLVARRGRSLRRAPRASDTTARLRAGTVWSDRPGDSPRSDQVDP